jgi:hypothetical protein
MLKQKLISYRPKGVVRGRLYLWAGLAKPAAMGDSTSAGVEIWKSEDYSNLQSLCMKFDSI